MKTLKLSLLASLIFGLSVFSNANDNYCSHVESDEIKTSIMKVEKRAF